MWRPFSKLSRLSETAKHLSNVSNLFKKFPNVSTCALPLHHVRFFWKRLHTAQHVSTYSKTLQNLSIPFFLKTACRPQPISFKWKLNEETIAGRTTAPPSKINSTPFQKRCIYLRTVDSLWALRHFWKTFGNIWCFVQGRFHLWAQKRLKIFDTLCNGDFIYGPKLAWDPSSSSPTWSPVGSIGWSMDSSADANVGSSPSASWSGSGSSLIWRFANKHPRISWLFGSFCFFPFATMVLNLYCIKFLSRRWLQSSFEAKQLWNWWVDVSLLSNCKKNIHIYIYIYARIRALYIMFIYVVHLHNICYPIQLIVGRCCVAGWGAG